MLAVMLSCVSCGVMIQCLHSQSAQDITFFVVLSTVSLSGVNCDIPCQL